MYNKRLSNQNIVSIQVFTGIVSNLTKFQCPSFRELEFPYDIEKQCKKSYSKISLCPLYPPMQPGPSEQTHAFRDILLAALLAMISVEYTHSSSSNSFCS